MLPAAAVLALALAAPAVGAAWLSSRVARAHALAAERRIARRAAPTLGRHVRIVRSHVGTCTRVSATVVDCRAATTYLVSEVSGPGVELADKALTRTTLRVTLAGGRVSVSPLAAPGAPAAR